MKNPGNQIRIMYKDEGQIFLSGKLGPRELTVIFTWDELGATISIGDSEVDLLLTATADPIVSRLSREL